MLSVAQAEGQILSLVIPLTPDRDSETVSLDAALGRILAQPILGSVDIPHWTHSSMDGYAVRHSDFQDASKDGGMLLEVIEEIPAGQVPRRSLQPGQAARIFTGAMVPEGADTVVMQENTVLQGHQVWITQVPDLGANIRHRGAFYQAGQPLLAGGIPIHAPELAILAAVQHREVRVFRRPQVVLFSTGDELVSPEQPLQAGQIVDSNQPALRALLTQMGIIPHSLGIIPDHPEALKQAIAQATATADVVISSGGVSVGTYDYVESLLAELGAEIHIRAVAVKPGKPLTVATFQCLGASDSKQGVYFGLPGNPVSALVSFWRFVQPALHKLSGLASGWGPMFVTGRSPHVLCGTGQRETYLWGRVQWRDGGYEFQLAEGGANSGNLVNLAQTNGLAVVPVGQTRISAGEPISILWLGSH